MRGCCMVEMHMLLIGVPGDPLDEFDKWGVEHVRALRLFALRLFERRTATGEEHEVYADPVVSAVRPWRSPSCCR